MWRHLKRQHSRFKTYRRTATRRLGRIGNFRTLRNGGFLFVWCNNARIRYDLAATIGFECRKLKTYKITVGNIKYRERDGTCCGSHGKIYIGDDWRCQAPTRDRRRGVEVGGRAKIATITIAASNESEFRAKLRTPLIIGDYDAGLDQYLANRDIQLGDELPDFIQFGWGFVDEKRVGARVRSGPPSFGKYVLILVGNQRLHIDGFRIRQLKAFGA